MILDDAIRNRRSVRGFLAKNVPRETMRDIFKLAQQAPSNRNTQPWIVHVVSGETLKGISQALLKASRMAKPFDPDFPLTHTVNGVYRERQVDCGKCLYGAMGIARGDIEGRRAAAIRNQEFFGAPHVAFMFMHTQFNAREAGDVGGYAQTLMLAMTSRGIASVAQGPISHYPNIIREHLGLAADCRLQLGVSFGYEDPSVKANDARFGRAPLDETVTFHG